MRGKAIEENKGSFSQRLQCSCNQSSWRNGDLAHFQGTFVILFTRLRGWKCKKKYIKKIPTGSYNDLHFLSFVEFDLSSFCKHMGPLNYSRLKHLRLDGNNVTHSSMPADAVNCLRQASDIMFE